MQGENALTLLLIGYALGLTMALLIMMSKRQTQPPTVVIQQAPEERDALGGCGTILLVAIVAVIMFALFGGITG